MSRLDLNGREGLAEAFDSTINRYTVRFNQGESLQLLASQLIHVNDASPDTNQKSILIKIDRPYLNWQHYQSICNTTRPSIQSHVKTSPLNSSTRYAMPSASKPQVPSKTTPLQLDTMGSDMTAAVKSPEDVIKAFLAKQEETVNAPEMCGDYTLEEYMGDEGNGERLTGTLLWFDQTKQFGFIAPESGNENYFTHGIDIYDQVYKGQKVHFEHGTDISGRKKACMVTPWGGYTRSGPCDPIYYQSTVALLSKDGSVPSQTSHRPRTIEEYYAMQNTNAAQKSNSGRPPWLVNTAIALPLEWNHTTET